MIIRWNRSGNKYAQQHYLSPGLGHAGPRAGPGGRSPQTAIPFFKWNTLCDLYDYSGVLACSQQQIFLYEEYHRGHFVNAQSTTTGRWTHVALVPPTLDIRDAYQPGSSFTDGFGTTYDTVWVTAHNSLTKVAYNVIFVERVGRGTVHDLKRVYLQRQAVAWPSANL